MHHMVDGTQCESWYYDGMSTKEVTTHMYAIQFNTKAERQNAFKQMRTPFNNLLKSIEKAELFTEDDCILLEDYGYAASMETEGGPPDPAFAAFHEALMLAFWKAREIVLDPEASPTRE